MRGGWFKESQRHRLARFGVKTAYYAKRKETRSGALMQAWFNKGENLLPSSYKAANRVPVGKLIVAGKKTPGASRKAGERVLPESREAGEETAEAYMARKYNAVRVWTDAEGKVHKEVTMTHDPEDQFYPMKKLNERMVPIKDAKFVVDTVEPTTDEHWERTSSFANEEDAENFRQNLSAFNNQAYGEKGDQGVGEVRPIDPAVSAAYNEPSDFVNVATIVKKGRHHFAKKRVKDKLKGGKGDNLPDEMFDEKQLRRGMKHELEHTKSPMIAKEIAKDHLIEDPKYYIKLDKMEKGKC